MLSRLPRPWSGPGPGRGGLRVLDPQQAAKITTATLDTYRKATFPFTTWLFDNHCSPNNSGEWDDLMVEYKNSEGLTKSRFQNLVAAVSFFFPRMAPDFKWSKSVIKGWDVIQTCY